jgi:hypothetical protein
MCFEYEMSILEGTNIYKHKPVITPTITINKVPRMKPDCLNAYGIPVINMKIINNIVNFNNYNYYNIFGFIV